MLVGVCVSELHLFPDIGMRHEKRKEKAEKENEMKFASLDSFNLPPFGVLSTERADKERALKGRLTTSRRDQ